MLAHHKIFFINVSTFSAGCYTQATSLWATSVCSSQTFMNAVENQPGGTERRASMQPYVLVHISSKQPTSIHTSMY